MEQTGGRISDLLSISTPVSLLVNKFDARRVLHGQVSLTTVNHIYDFNLRGNERLQKSKYLLKACFENVNILKYRLFYRKMSIKA